MSVEEILLLKSKTLDPSFKVEFDVIIFNPPYVVTSKEELSEAQSKMSIEASWAGGEYGISVL